jgi:hypothetical protein
MFIAITVVTIFMLSTAFWADTRPRERARVRVRVIRRPRRE